MKGEKSGKRGRGKEGGGAGDPGGSARREGRQTAEGYTAGKGPLGGRGEGETAKPAATWKQLRLCLAIGGGWREHFPDEG